MSANDILIAIFNFMRGTDLKPNVIYLGRKEMAEINGNINNIRIIPVDKEAFIHVGDELMSDIPWYVVE